MPVCNVCEVDKDEAAFEKHRKACKDCRKDQKKKRAADREVDPATAPRPAECAGCRKPFDPATFRFRTETGTWRSTCKECFNKKHYSRAHYRQHRDDPEFLRKNAEHAAKWRQVNPEAHKAIQHKRKVDPAKRFQDLVAKPAAVRGIAVAADDVPAMTAKMRQACAYCAYAPKDDEKCNGLDRLDNAAGFTDANTVPACSLCNAMKHSLPLDAFLAHAHRIAAHSCSGIVPPADRGVDMDDVLCGKRGADAKDKDDSALSVARKIKMWTSPCYLCGHRYALGIDRIDSRRGYEPGNVAPCCRNCNYMKKHMDLERFKVHIACIVDTRPAPDVDDPVRYDNVSGKVLEPVGAFDDDDRMVMAFPARATANRILGLSHYGIKDGKKARGLAWRPIDARTFLGFRNDNFAHHVAVHTKM